jgi:cobalt/nickel transport system permease protein
MHLIAVHIADVLPAPWWAAGYVSAAVLLAVNARRLTDAEIPRLSLLSAVFFVASLIHIKIGVSSAHLLLNGLVGVVLGRRAVLAIAVGLVLQAVLIGHGGYTSLGVNICTMTLPAYLAAALCAALRHVPWLRRPLGRGLLVVGCVVLLGVSLSTGVESLVAELHGRAMEWFARPAGWWSVHPLTLTFLLGIGSIVAALERLLENSPDFPIGLLVGEVSVLSTVALTAVVLRLALPGEAGTVAPVVFVAHLPIAAVEGIVCGFVISFLMRVAPEMLASSSPGQREQFVHRDLPLAQADADHG